MKHGKRVVRKEYTLRKICGITKVKQIVIGSDNIMYNLKFQGIEPLVLYKLSPYIHL